MPKKKYIISLTADERKQLEQLTKTGKAPQLISGFNPWVRLSEILFLHSIPPTQTKMTPVI